jgi:hypothetical protein
MGALAVLLGMFRLSRGVLSVNNVYAMPIASGAVVAFGVILLLFAVIPLIGSKRPPPGCFQAANIRGLTYETARFGDSGVLRSARAWPV